MRKSLKLRTSIYVSENHGADKSTNAQMEEGQGIEPERNKATGQSRQGNKDTSLDERAWWRIT